MAFVGIVTGLLGALPLVIVRRTRPRMAWGIAAAIASFALLHVAVLLVWRMDRPSLVPFATCVVLGFLATVTFECLRK